MRDDTEPRRSCFIRVAPRFHPRRKHRLCTSARRARPGDEYQTADLRSPDTRARRQGATAVFCCCFFSLTHLTLGSSKQEVSYLEHQAFNNVYISHKALLGPLGRLLLFQFLTLLVARSVFTVINALRRSLISLRRPLAQVEFSSLNIWTRDLLFLL